jgi:tRNA G18 (ribose-2'-O)-methylase SpoU
MSVIKANTFFKQSDFDGPVIILDGLLTPDNVGSVFRLAGNIGCKRVVLTERVELAQTKIEKIARNSLQYLKIEFLSYQEIATEFKNIIAIETTNKATDLYETKLPKEATFIVGNEKRGISEELLKYTNRQIFIPMPGQVKSLNVSHALSVVLFEWYRQNFSI